MTYATSSARLGNRAAWSLRPDAKLTGEGAGYEDSINQVPCGRLVSTILDRVDLRTTLGPPPSMCVAMK